MLLQGIRSQKKNCEDLMGLLEEMEYCWYY